MKHETISIFTRTENLRVTTVAIVSFVTSKKMSELQIIKSLINSLTEWAKTTKKGKEAWIQSCEDFNIGDLTNYEKKFKTWLKKKDMSITDFEILYCGDTKEILNFDTVLMNKSELAGKPIRILKRWLIAVGG